MEKPETIMYYRQLLMELKFDSFKDGGFFKTDDYPKSGWIEFASDIQIEIDTLNLILS